MGELHYTVNTFWVLIPKRESCAYFSSFWFFFFLPLPITNTQRRPTSNRSDVNHTTTLPSSANALFISPPFFLSINSFLSLPSPLWYYSNLKMQFGDEPYAIRHTILFKISLGAEFKLDAHPIDAEYAFFQHINTQHVWYFKHIEHLLYLFCNIINMCIFNFTSKHNFERYNLNIKSFK